MPRRPSHFELVVKDGEICKANAYFDGQEYAGELERGDGVREQAGTFPTIGEALAAAEKLWVDDYQKIDRLARFRSLPSVQFLVTIDQVDHQFAIVVGSKRGYEDSGLRFNSRGEAEVVIRETP